MKKYKLIILGALMVVFFATAIILGQGAWRNAMNAAGAITLCFLLQSIVEKILTS